MLKPIISADSHVSEPPNCYLDYISPKFRDRAPRLVHDEKRGDMFHIEGSKSPIPMSLVSARVGVADSIMDSSICVATIAGFAAARQRRTSRF